MLRFFFFFHYTLHSPFLSLYMSLYLYVSPSTWIFFFFCLNDAFVVFSLSFFVCPVVISLPVRTLHYQHGGVTPVPACLLFPFFFLFPLSQLGMITVFYFSPFLAKLLSCSVEGQQLSTKKYFPTIQNFTNS